jgi:hypothetical protein
MIPLRNILEIYLEARRLAMADTNHSRAFFEI